MAIMVLAGQAWAEPMARIEGVENEALLERLNAIIDTQSPAPTTRWAVRDRAARASERIRRYLDSQGYFGALVDARVDSGMQAIVRVRPGLQFSYGNIDIELIIPETDYDMPSPDISDQLTLQTGTPMTAQDVLSDEIRLVQALQESGWIDARAAEREVIADHARNEVNVTYRIETGPYIVFGAPQLAGGLADLRESYVARLAPYDIGEPARHSLLERYTQRLQSLDSVALADTQIAFDADGKERPVDVRMEPAPRHALALAVRYSTTDGPGAEVEWKRRNLFRGDETLTLTGRAAALQSIALAELEFPNWRRYDQSIRLSGGYTFERTDAFDQEAIPISALISRRLSNSVTASTGIRFQTARIQDAAGERTLNTVSFPSELVYDDRGDVLDPKSGIYLIGGVTPGLSGGDESTRYTRLVGEARSYYPITPRYTAAIRIRAGSLVGASPEAVPADLRFYAGGGGSVRGYEYQALSPLRTRDTDGVLEPFGGRSLTEISAELRWRRSDRLGFTAFIDGGVANSDTMPSFDGLRYGAGLGVRYYPGFGPIRLDIATPLDPDDGDDPVHLYISIGQAF